MKRALTVLASFSMLAGGMAFAGEARSVSIATDGGSANSSATAIGNASALAIAGASRGGQAVANSTAIGAWNGYADSRSVAAADRGLAVSNANADARGAYGGQAIAESESIAATIGGVALSHSDAVARGTFFGRAHSRSYSTATSDHGFSLSNSQAVSDGLSGGFASSVSDSLADTYRGVSISDVRAVSGARWHARAASDGQGISLTGPYRTSRTNVFAESRALRYANTRAQAMSVEVRP